MPEDSNFSSLSSEELARQRYELVQRLGEYDMELENRRHEGRIHVKGEELEWQEGPLVKPLDGKITLKTTPIITPERGFDASTLMAFMGELAPKTGGGKYHRHNEAVKYYLSGRGVEIVGDKEYQVKAGDFVFIPANVWHGTQNPYDEPLRFYAVAMQPGNPVQTAAPYVQNAHQNFESE